MKNKNAKKLQRLEQIVSQVRDFKSAMHWSEEDSPAHSLWALRAISIILLTIACVIAMFININWGISILMVEIVIFFLLKHWAQRKTHKAKKHISEVQQDNETATIYIRTDAEYWRPLLTIQSTPVAFGRLPLKIRCAAKPYEANYIHATLVGVGSIEYQEHTEADPCEPGTVITVKTNRRPIQFLIVGHSEPSPLVQSFQSLIETYSI